MTAGKTAALGGAAVIGLAALLFMRLGAQDPPRDKTRMIELGRQHKTAAAFEDANSALGVQRADGFRFLTQNLGQAFDFAFETKDTRYPAVHMFCSPTRKLGGDCPISSTSGADRRESTYRIVGDRGTARFSTSPCGTSSATAPGVSARTKVRRCAEGNLFGSS